MHKWKAVISAIVLSGIFVTSGCAKQTEMSESIDDVEIFLTCEKKQSLLNEGLVEYRTHSSEIREVLIADTETVQAYASVSITVLSGDAFYSVGRCAEPGEKFVIVVTEFVNDPTISYNDGVINTTGWAVYLDVEPSVRTFYDEELPIIDGRKMDNVFVQVYSSPAASRTFSLEVDVKVTGTPGDSGLTSAPEDFSFSHTFSVVQDEVVMDIEERGFCEIVDIDGCPW